MLLELVVENYAVVERARVRFHPGLNLLTGETGSGKSIIVDALGLLFGGRASADAVRAGARCARVSGIFEVSREAGLAAVLEDAGVESENGELLIEREILAEGKSRAFAGGRPVPAGFLRELAPRLGDIHGQHDQQLLFSPEAQLRMLDDFGNRPDLLASVGELYERWRAFRREREELDHSEQEKLRMLDLWTFQQREITTAAVRAGEDTELENERAVLKNVARLQENAGAAYAALYESKENAAAQIRLALKKLEDLCRIDASLQPVVEMLRPAGIAVEEAGDSVRHYLERLEADPARLEEVESRLAALDRLKRKYGPQLEQVLQFAADVEARIAAAEHAGERRLQLERELKNIAAVYEDAAKTLSQSRAEAARKLSARVEKELAQLALANSIFQVMLSTGQWSERGLDRVAFLVSSNPGEEPKPLDRVASGGELSRIALALKTCLEPADGAAAQRTLVFDEVDAGIGGSVAEAVGRRLKRLSQANQVLCVTHLAQIAGFADHHYHVEKRQLNGRTVAAIEELTGQARTQEIGRMLSGERITPEALKHAEQLIRAASRR